MENETAARQRVLGLLAETLQAAGLPGVAFTLKESRSRPDAVEIYQGGRLYRVACIDCDSLSAMVRDVLDQVI